MDRAVYLQWESNVEKHDVGRIDLVPLLHNFGHSGPPSSVRCAQVIAPRPPFAFCAPTPVLNLVPTLRTLKAALLWCRRSVVADGCIRGLVMIGSESARERIRPPELFPDEAAGSDASTSSAEIYGQRPFGLAPPQILMLHSARDPVISRLAIQQLVREPTKSIFEKWRWCFKSYTPSGA